MRVVLRWLGGLTVLACLIVGVVFSMGSTAAEPGGADPEEARRSGRVDLDPQLARHALPLVAHQTKAAPLTAPEPLASPVAAKGEVTIEGILLDPQGQPVAGKVEPWRFLDRAIQGNGGSTVGPDGRFRLVIRKPGTYGLFAEGTSDADSLRRFYGPPVFDLGTGASELIKVDLEQPIPFQQLTVSGAGVLRGRLVDADGAPAAAVSLQVFRARDIRESKMRGERAAFAWRGGGHRWLITNTDSHGYFEFLGLAEDHYNVETDHFDQVSINTLRLTNEPVPADGQPILVELTRPYLAIHVLQAAGSVLEELYGSSPPEFSIDSLGGWPERPEVFAALVGDSVRGRHGAQLKVVRIESGEFFVDLPRDGTRAREVYVDIGLRGGASAWEPRRIHVPVGARRMDVDVHMPVEQECGTLVLEAVDASGDPIQGPLRVSVMDGEGGSPFVRRSWSTKGSSGDPFQARLPAGEHLLTVEGHSIVGGYHADERQERLHGGVEAPVHIRAGGETAVVVTLGEGARLHLALSGSVTDESREALREVWTTEGYGFDEERLESRVKQVALRLERVGRVPAQVPFTKWILNRFLRPTTESSLRFGADATSNLLTPGDYTLVAVAYDGRTLRRPVSLVAGETLDVTLEFD